MELHSSFSGGDGLILIEGVFVVRFWFCPWYKFMDSSLPSLSFYLLVPHILLHLFHWAGEGEGEGKGGEGEGESSE